MKFADKLDTLLEYGEMTGFPTNPDEKPDTAGQAEIPPIEEIPPETGEAPPPEELKPDEGEADLDKPAGYLVTINNTLKGIDTERIVEEIKSKVEPDEIEKIRNIITKFKTVMAKLVEIQVGKEGREEIKAPEDLGGEMEEPLPTDQTIPLPEFEPEAGGVPSPPASGISPGAPPTV